MKKPNEPRRLLEAYPKAEDFSNPALGDHITLDGLYNLMAEYQGGWAPAYRSNLAYVIS